VLAAVGSLAMVGSMVAIAAPASAAPTAVGNCSGALQLATFKDATNAPTTLGDQTAIGTTISSKLMKNLATSTNIAGTCAAAVRPGDPQQPAGGLAEGGALTVKSVAGKLVGNLGCASGATAEAADATAAAAWSPSGKITWGFNELNDLGKPWQIQAQVAFLGEDPSAAPDDVDLTGLVLKGPAVGANVVGAIWQDPAAKLAGKARNATVSVTNGSGSISSTTGTLAKFVATDIGGTISGPGIAAPYSTITAVASLQNATMAPVFPGTTQTSTYALNFGSYQTGYVLDFANAIGCQNGTANDAAIASVMSGGGGGTSSSLLGSSVPAGVTFTLGQ